MVDNIETEKYPLRFPSEAYRLLRSYRIGPLKSFNPNPESTELSQQKVVTIWHGPEGHFSLDMENDDHVLWVRLSLAIDVLSAKYGNNPRFKAFKACRIGLADPQSDTGDCITLSLKQIATAEGRSITTIHRWVDRVEDEFISILKERGLLSPDWGIENIRLN